MKSDTQTGQETSQFACPFGISAMCILLVRTTKLLAQKIRHDNTGSEKLIPVANKINKETPQFVQLDSHGN